MAQVLNCNLKVWNQVLINTLEKSMNPLTPSNTGLNSIIIVLLWEGWYAIKQRNQTKHFFLDEALLTIINLLNNISFILISVHFS